MNDVIASYFNNLAPSWDNEETITKEKVVSLLNMVEINRGDKILDIGCGTGVVTGLLHDLSNNDVYAIDLSSKMIALAKQKYQNQKWAHFINDDVFTYKFKNKFDKAIIYNAYPHFIDVESFASVLNDLLNENGEFIILHSLGRKNLNKVHHNCPDTISRSISSPDEEGKYFKKYFNIIKAEENDDYYLLQGKKIK